MVKLSNRSKFLVFALSILGFLAVFWLFSGSPDSDDEPVFAEVSEGPFEVRVISTGELQAEKSENVSAPGGLRNAGVFQVKISQLVPEGTIVRKGDFIASLDRTETTSRLKDRESDLQKAESQFIKTKLDTTLELRQARDELINLKSNVEEKKIVLEQSKYEPPATIRQSELELEKAQRNFDQATRNYQIKTEQAKARMREADAAFQQAQRKYDMLLEILDEFEIKAPKDGMVIYHKDNEGMKRTVGATVNPWDLTVATLPDLTSMISRTFINEIDISKISKGMRTDISIDAFPLKGFTGKISEIANVGEQLPNSDAKVFEVKILIEGTDSLWRPGMTTGNSILINKTANTLFIPLECVYSNDSVTYIFKSQGLKTVKKKIKTGMINDNEAEILEGLSKGEKIFMSLPKNVSDLQFAD